MREAEFHRSVADLLCRALPRDAVWSTISHENTSAKHGAMLERKGVKPGLPDIMILYRGAFVGVELKSARGVPSLVQVQMGLAIEKAGGRWFIARSIDDLIAKLKLAGVPLRASTGRRAAA